jgi:hypothetical protein
MTDQTNDPFDVIYARDPSIVARQIAAEMLLVPIRQNVGDLESIYLLNETAQFTWEHLDGKHTLGEICRLITGEFEVDQSQAGLDLLELIADLESVGALMKI